ncbi:HEAT repeat domain-containing protein [Myxococcota bacterium]|nr:HEAT repeat domain-containing protein [Myxococcota bacterium]
MVGILARRSALPAAVLCALALVTSLAEAWGGGGSAGPAPDRKREVLERLAREDGLLINLDPYDLPATSDLVRLGRPATPAVVNGLVGSMSPDVRAACALVLTATRDPRALGPLLDALDDPEYAVRSRAIQALGSLESRQATARLLDLVGKKGVPEYLREEAVRALGRLGDPQAVRPLLDRFRTSWDPATQQALWDLRRLLPARALEEVVVAPLRAAPSGDVPPDVLEFSVERAGDLRLTAAVRPLVALVDHAPHLQNRVIYNLGRVGDPAALPFLRSRLDRTADARLVNNVVFALQRLGEDPAPFLGEALADRRAYIRFNAAFVAGDLKAKAVVPALTAALGDPNDYVRSEVAVALGRIGDAAAIPALEAASREANPVVRRDAVIALARLDYPRHHGRVVEELLSSDLDSVRDAAVRFLADGGDAAVVPAVLARLDPGSWQDRGMGIALLSRLPGPLHPDATAFLVRVATGSGHAREALEILARHPDDHVRFLLRPWLHTPGGEQDLLMRALGRLGDEGAEPMARSWLEGEDAESRLHAAFLLASLGRPEGVERLVAAIEDAPVELKRVATARLAELPGGALDGATPRLAAMLDHEDVYVRLYAARVLAARGDERAWARLWGELGKRIPFVADEVLDIAERAPRARSEPVLRAWRERADPLLRADLDRILASPG